MGDERVRSSSAEVHASHESRLQTLEASVRTISTELGVHSERSKGFAERAEESLYRLGLKVDYVSDRLAALPPRLDKIESINQASQKRMSALRKALWGLAVGGVGVLVDRLVVLVFHLHQ